MARTSSTAARALCVAAALHAAACGGRTLDSGSTGDDSMGPSGAPGEAGDPWRPRVEPDFATDPGGPEPIGAPPPPPRDLTESALDRCQEVCRLPELECQPTLGGPSCVDGCRESIPPPDPPHCVDLFFELTYCLEEAALVAACGPEFGALLADMCAPVAEILTVECRGPNVSPPPPPPPGVVECRVGSEASGSGSCITRREVCTDGREYEVACSSIGGAVECECFLDGRSQHGFGVPGDLPVEEYCYSPMGFDMCGFPVAW